MSKFIPYQDLIAGIYYDHPLTKQKKQLVYNITFQVTDNCNLACTYCYEINKNYHIMDFETAKKFIDLILNPDNNTKDYIDSWNSIGAIIEFIGGEPLLAIDLIDQITDYFIEQCILLNHPWQYYHVFSICSNGTLYFQSKVQQYLKKNQNNLSFSISIDGNKQLHDSCRIFPNGQGSYDLAIAAARDWMNVWHGDMGSKMTLSPQNIQYTKEAVIGLLNENYKNINLNCIYEKGWTYEHAQILYKQLTELADYILMNGLEYDVDISMFKEYLGCPKPITDVDNWCGGNGQMIAVDWKGDIFPCLRYMESSLGNTVPPYIIGNIYEGIGNNAKCANCIKTLKAVNRITQSTEECINCPIAEGCAWCQAYNYQDSGGNVNHRATYICVMHKARVLANCYYQNLKYWKNKEDKRFRLYLPDQEALKIISKEELEFLKQLQYPNIY